MLRSKILAGLTTGALLAGMMGTALLSPASAADVSYTTVTIKKVSDGTGQDQNGTHCFINTANGYKVADDTATDGVVCVNDSVTYEVGMAFQAGPERDVNVRLTGFNFAGTQFCQDTAIATATGTDGNCTFRVKAGAVGSINRTVTVVPTTLANDVRAKIAVTGGTSALADPVTVVGMPQADLRLTADVTTYNYTASGTGTFKLTPYALSNEGWAEKKGSLTAGLNWKVSKVEGFPAGTTFKVGGINLVGGTFKDEQVVTFKLPDGTYPTPDNDVQNYITYKAKVSVDASSFSATVGGVTLKNNGSGVEPGTPDDCFTPTSDFGFGAVDGQLAVNNNCGNFTFYVKVPSGDLFIKDVYAPFDVNHDYFHEANRLFSVTPKAVRGGIIVTEATPSTEVNALLITDTAALPTDAPLVTLCDTWSDDKVVYDSSRAITADLVDTKLSESIYSVQYSTAATLDGSCDGSTWTTTKPADASIKGVKVTFIKGGVKKNTGVLTVTVPVKTAATYSPNDGGLVSVDKATLKLDDTVTLQDDGAVRLKTASTPVDSLKLVVATQNEGLVFPNEVINHTVSPSVLNVEETTPKPIVVTLDPCEGDPKLSSGAYTMSIQQGTATCENPTGTKTTVTFTPTSATKLQWNMNENRTDQSSFVFTTKVSSLVDNTTTSGYTLKIGAVYGTASDASTLLVPQSSERTSYVNSDPKLVEVEQPLNWTVDISRRADNAVGESIIILPENGSTTPYDGSDPGNAYTGSKSSSFHGTVALSGLSLVNASAGTKLYVNTNKDATFSDSGWVEYTSSMDLSNYKSVKVVTPDNAVANTQVKVTMQPTGNLKDDVYLLGLTETPVAGLTTLPKPWPAEIKVVSSSVSGYVVNDGGNINQWDVTDNPYSGITVTLKDANGNVVGTTTTDSKGYYEFTDLKSGNYTVTVNRSQIPSSTLDDYGQTHAVSGSFSYPNFTKSNSKDVANVTIPVAGNIPHVDFGYLSPNPKLLLDKESKGVVDNGDGTVTASWDVTVKNNGNIDLTGVKLTDNLPSGAFDIQASIEYQKQVLFGPNNLEQDNFYSDGEGNVYYKNSYDYTVSKVSGLIADPLESFQNSFIIDIKGDVYKAGSKSAVKQTFTAPTNFSPTGKFGMYGVTDANGKLYIIDGNRNVIPVEPTVTFAPNIPFDGSIVDSEGNIWVYKTENIVKIKDNILPPFTKTYKESGTDPRFIGNDGKEYFYYSYSDTWQVNTLDIPLSPRVFEKSYYGSQIIVADDNGVEHYLVNGQEISVAVPPEVQLEPGDHLLVNYTMITSPSNVLGYVQDKYDENIGATVPFWKSTGVILHERYKGPIQQFVTDINGVTYKIESYSTSKEITYKNILAPGTMGTALMGVDKYGKIFSYTGYSATTNSISNATIIGAAANFYTGEDAIYFANENGRVSYVKGGVLTVTDVYTTLTNTTFKPGPFNDNTGAVWYAKIHGGLEALNMPAGTTFDKSIIENEYGLRSILIADTSGELWAFEEDSGGNLSYNDENVLVAPNITSPGRYDNFIGVDGKLYTYQWNNGNTILTATQVQTSLPSQFIKGYFSDNDGVLWGFNGGLVQYSGVIATPNLYIENTSNFFVKDVPSGKTYHVTPYTSNPVTPSDYDLRNKAWESSATVKVNNDGQASFYNYWNGSTTTIDGIDFSAYAGQDLDYSGSSVFYYTDGEGKLYTSDQGSVVKVDGTPVYMEPNHIYIMATHYWMSGRYPFVDRDGDLYVASFGVARLLKEGDFGNNRFVPLDPSASSYSDQGIYLSDSTGEIYAFKGNSYGWSTLGSTGLYGPSNNQWFGKTIAVNTASSIEYKGGVGIVYPNLNTTIDTASITIKNGEPYNIGTLKTGTSPEQAIVHIKATFRKGSAPQTLVNQAWATSDQAPYETNHGVYNGANESPTPADGTNVTGNATCTAIGFDGDICDQVPLYIEGSAEPLGNLNGNVWYDPNHDGIRDADETNMVSGITVTLYRGDTNYGTATTDANGHYEFVGLPAGNDYKVVFSLIGNTYDGKPIAISPQTPASDTNNDAGANGSTSLLTIVANETTNNIDAGIWTPQAHITATKTFEQNGQQVSMGELDLTNGKTTPTKVTFSFTNDGEEPLEKLKVIDEQQGAVLPDFTCDPALAGLTLAVGESVTCTATLPAMQAGEQHYDLATVTGYGSLTTREVSGSDDITVTTPNPFPSLEVKKYVNDSNWNVVGGTPSNDATSDTDPSDAQTSPTAVNISKEGFNTTYIVTNNGNLPIEYVTVYDRVDGQLVPINGTCPKLTLNPGESMVCYGNQVITAGGITQTNGVATGVATVFNQPLQGLKAEDEAFVELAGNVDVTVYLSMDGTDCYESNSNCVPLGETPASIGGVTGATDGSGTYVGPYAPNGNQDIMVNYPDWTTYVSHSVNGGTSSTTQPGSVTVVPGETQHVVVTLKLDGTPPSDGPTPPVFESGM